MARISFVKRRIYGGLIDLLICVGLGAPTHPFGWVVSTGYWLLRDSLFNGQSVGKRLLRLKVTVGRDRERCTVTASIIRNILWIVPGINLLMAVSTVLAYIEGRSGRHWGDRLAETQVVNG